MQCSYRSQLAEYDVGALPPARRDKVRTHLASCPACRQELAALQATARLLGPMEQHDAPADTWEQVRARLKPRRSDRQGVRHWAPVFAAAMVLLLVFSFALPSLHSPVATPELPDTEGYVAVQLAAAWDNPLADKAALGLAMLAVETGSEPVEVLD